MPIAVWFTGRACGTREWGDPGKDTVKAVKAAGRPRASLFFRRGTVYSVYVLNNSYECVSRTSFERAHQLIERRSAEVVKWSDQTIRTATRILRVPLMIRIFKYVRAFGRTMKFSKRFVWERDDFICQYCGKRITSKKDLETDHIYPESRGGREVYENMVTACRPCNQKKADRTPQEAGMRLRRDPFIPQASRNMLRIAAEAKKVFDEMEW